MLSNSNEVSSDEYTSPITAIIGAGASHEYGLPLVGQFFNNDLLTLFESTINLITAQANTATQSSDGMVVCDNLFWQDKKRTRAALSAYVQLLIPYSEGVSQRSELNVNIEYLYQMLYDWAECMDVDWFHSAKELLEFYVWSVITLQCLRRFLTDKKLRADYNRLWSILGNDGSLLSFNWDSLSALPDLLPDEWPLQLKKGFALWNIGLQPTQSEVISEDEGGIHIKSKPEPLQALVNNPQIGSWLPLHGSILAQRCPSCEPGSSSIFNQAQNFLLQAPKPHLLDDVTLARAYTHLASAKCPICFSRLRPLILAPTVMKDISLHRVFKSIWLEACRVLSRSETIIIIGYSWGANDERARNALRYALRAYTGKRTIKRLIVVDKLRSNEDTEAGISRIKKHYTDCFGEPGRYSGYHLDDEDIFLSGFSAFINLIKPAMSTGGAAHETS